MATLSPAALAIEKLGAKRIAERCDLTTNAVWKWETTGGGLIPAKHQKAVLALAADLKVEFTADHIVGIAA